MTILWQSRLWRFASPLLGLAVGCSLIAQGRCQQSRATAERPIVSANSIDPVEAGVQLDSLLSRLHNPSSLLRVQTLEAIDLSPAITAETANSILRDALDDRDPILADTALRALLHRGDEQLPLVRASDLAKLPGETGELAHVRLAADNRDISALRELMLNGDAVVQESAFEALAANDADAAVALLQEEFRDPSSLYRLQTLELFVRSPYTNSPATLTSILQSATRDEDPLVRQRAKQVLENQKSGVAREE